MNPIDISLELISKKSISGERDQGSIDYLAKHLSKLGFEVIRQEFSGDDSYVVDNIYAEFGDADQNLCFAGHTDVVSPGDEKSWSVPPFKPQIVDGYLIGRGAVDMKSSIASFLSAVSEVITENKGDSDFKDKVKLSFLITGDEEADAVNGTIKLLKYISEKGKKINSCIVGEPTNPEELGEMIKVGRRGSANFKLTVNGVQGHVAYPDKADNPNDTLVDILSELKSVELDSGNKYFPPSNLEITSIDVGNGTTNLIPANATASFNIRFNDEHNGEAIRKWVEDISMKHSSDYELVKIGTGSESFLSKPAKLAGLLADSCKEMLDKSPEYSTTGGTSDARFIKDYVNEVAEFGLINKTAHKVDEKVKAEEIEQLKEIYKKTIIKYFDL